MLRIVCNAFQFTKFKNWDFVPKSVAQPDLPSLEYNLEHNLEHDLERNLERDLERNLELNLERNQEHNLEQNLERSLNSVKITFYFF